MSSSPASVAPNDAADVLLEQHGAAVSCLALVRRRSEGTMVHSIRVVSPACPKLAEKHPRDMRIRAAETNPDPAWMPAFVVDRRHLERMRAAVAL